MSDIDRTRMIPLHIADQAVAACDAEIAKLREENARLKAEVERLTKENALATPRHLIASQDITSLREQVERLTNAVMHSPAAQLKLKELEGKTTFDEINPKGGQP
jgi:ubiquinone biosynthesis protein UbiJ